VILLITVTGSMPRICPDTQTWFSPAAGRSSMCASASGTGIRARTGRGLRKPIQEYWVSKTERNVARDRDNVEEWKRQSWDVLVLWECQAKEREALKRVILAFLPRRLKARTSGVSTCISDKYHPVSWTIQFNPKEKPILPFGVNSSAGSIRKRGNAGSRQGS
jgi:hypothetical protein